MQYLQGDEKNGTQPRRLYRVKESFGYEEKI